MFQTLSETLAYKMFLNRGTRLKRLNRTYETKRSKRLATFSPFFSRTNYPSERMRIYVFFFFFFHFSYTSKWNTSKDDRLVSTGGVFGLDSIVVEFSTRSSERARGRSPSSFAERGRLCAFCFRYGARGPTGRISRFFCVAADVRLVGFVLILRSKTLRAARPRYEGCVSRPIFLVRSDVRSFWDDAVSKYCNLRSARVHLDSVRPQREIEPGVPGFSVTAVGEPRRA